LKINWFIGLALLIASIICVEHAVAGSRKLPPVLDCYVQAAKVRKVLILPRLNERERIEVVTLYVSEGTSTTIITTTIDTNELHEIEDVNSMFSNRYDTGASSVST
jgi:hypothetical protein